MKTVSLPNDVKVFGMQVKTFPLGISEAFDKLVKMIPGNFNRSFYGISYMEEGKMIYYAAAEELSSGEAEKYSCERLTVEKGEYLTEALNNWRNKTDQIKDIFRQLVNDERADKTKPGVEWYKNESEMLCMVRKTGQAE